MGETKTRRGHCLCGAVAIEAAAVDNDMGACHCSMCRKWVGGPLLAVECGRDVRIDGDANVSVFPSSDWAERGFCSRCGTHLFYRLKESGEYMIPPGLFDDGDDWVFKHQIFIDEKPPYYAFANETRDLTAAEVFAQYAPPT
ncbi:GFA family protein [Arhodomonas sp. AD133]|uniref:GFA family protein n=1 Tax=Arhodomonas sp. AD133 TaxID=3415009 RepID=UPI003EBA3AD9